MGKQELENAPQPTQKKEDRESYLMLFCALLMAKNSKATLEQSMKVVPLSRRARRLASEIVQSARQIETPHPVV